MSIHHLTNLRRLAITGSIVAAGVVFYNRATIVEHVFGQADNYQTTPKLKDKIDQTEQQQLASLSYAGQQTQTVNNGQPEFTKEELKSGQKAGQKLFHLDLLGRPQTANAMLNKSLMLTQKREALTVKTPGYKVYRFSDNGRQNYLYNRSHLIGFQLTGLNNDRRNLVTGTVAMNATHASDNQQSMEDYENEIAHYLRADESHYVRYRVTPLYRNFERVPRGVQMEAASITDATVRFNVYVFNAQPGWQLNYYTGTAIQTN